METIELKYILLSHSLEIQVSYSRKGKNQNKFAN